MVKNLVRILFAGAAVTAAGLGITWCGANIGEEVFRGNVDGYEAVYEEGRFYYATNSNFSGNRITLQKGDVEYKFWDWGGETDINWRAETEPDFKKDKLNRVEVIVGGRSKTYFPENIIGPDDPQPSKGWPRNKDNLVYVTISEETSQVMDRANALYNGLREKIRATLRQDYLETHEKDSRPYVHSFDASGSKQAESK